MADPAPELDIAALLAMTFEAKPSDELAERVASRVALTTTVSELLRLVTAGPWHWLRDEASSLHIDESAEREDS